jgi:competence protein ComEC
VERAVEEDIMKGLPGKRVRRPALWISGGYILGIVLAGLFRLDSIIFWSLAVLLFFFVCYLCIIEKNCILVLIFVFWVLGFVHTCIQYNAPNPLRSFVGENISIKGVVHSYLQDDSQKLTYIVKVEEVAGTNISHKKNAVILLNIYENSTDEMILRCQPGDKIEVRGEFREPPGQRNPGCFDYNAYLKRRGIYAIMDSNQKDVHIIGKGNFSFLFQFTISSKAKIESLIDKYVQGDGSGLLKTMLLGDRDALSPVFAEDFAKTGLSHVLAISGLHVGFLVLLLNSFTKILGLSQRQNFIVQMLVLGFYCILAGASPSILRAVIMFTVYSGGKVIGRKSDPLNNIALAALGILIFKPLELFEVGFQLSFVAVLGIILFQKVICKKLQFLPRWLASSVSVTLSAQLGVWPLIAYYFNTFSVISILANLALVPLAGLILIGGFILILFGLLLPFLAGFLGWIIGWFCIIFLKGNQLFSAIPYSCLRVISPSLIALACYYGVFLILSYECPKWIRKPSIWCAGIIGFYLVAVVLYPWLIQNDLHVVFLDVGQGDCIYIRTPDERHVLIDGGGKPEAFTGNYNVGEEVVLPFLLKNGVSKLDLVIMTHQPNQEWNSLFYC